MAEGRSAETRIEEAALNSKMIAKKGGYFWGSLQKGKGIYDDPDMIERCCSIEMYQEEKEAIQDYLQRTFGAKNEFIGLTTEDYGLIAERCLETLVFLAENNADTEDNQE